MLVLNPKITITMNSARQVLYNAYIGIDNDKIVYVSNERPKNYEELLVLPNHILIPGFVNAHTHVPMTILRGLKDDVDLRTWLDNYILPLERRLKASDVYYAALYGIAEMIRSGITTFLDMYYHESSVAKAVVDSGIRAMVSYGTSDVFFNATPEEKIRENLKLLGEIEKLRERHHVKDRLFFAYGPHSPYGCSRKLLELIKDHAKTTGFRIHIHLSETRWELDQIKKQTGRTPIKYLYDIGLLSERVMAAHVVWPTDEELLILKKCKVNVIHNPISNLKLASGVAPIPKMLKENINVSLGTDGPASNNRLDMFREMHVAALIHKGVSGDPKNVPASTVMEMATVNGAKALGLDNLIGSIEVGKKADVVIINLDKGLHGIPEHDPYSMLVYALDQNYIESVMVDGKWIYKDGGYVTIKIDQLKKKVQSIRERLISDST